MLGKRPTQRPSCLKSDLFRDSANNDGHWTCSINLYKAVITLLNGMVHISFLTCEPNQ